MAEDQGPAAEGVDRQPGGVDEEDGAGVAPAGEKAGRRRDDQERRGRETEAAEVRRLQGLQVRGMTGPGHDRFRGRRQRQEKHAADQAEIERLPDDRSDAPRPAGAGVLGDEGGRVIGRVLQQTHRGPKQDGRRQGGPDLIAAGPAEQHALHEDLQGPEAVGEDERPGQAQQLRRAARRRNATALSRMAHALHLRPAAIRLGTPEHLSV